MKTTRLIFAIAAVAMLTSVASADNALLSPKARELQRDSRTVPGTTPDMWDRSVKLGSPKAIAFAESLRKVPGTAPDMLVRNTGAFSPRVLADNPSLARQFQVAPLK